MSGARGVPGVSVGVSGAFSTGVIPSGFVLRLSVSDSVRKFL